MTLDFTDKDDETWCYFSQAQQDVCKDNHRNARVPMQICLRTVDSVLAKKKDMFRDVRMRGTNIHDLAKANDVVNMSFIWS